jgi:hypothetical protein
VGAEGEGEVILSQKGEEICGMTRKELQGHWSALGEGKERQVIRTKERKTFWRYEARQTGVKDSNRSIVDLFPDVQPT